MQTCKQPYSSSDDYFCKDSQTPGGFNSQTFTPFFFFLRRNSLIDKMKLGVQKGENPSLRELQKTSLVVNQ